LDARVTSIEGDTLTSDKVSEIVTKILANADEETGEKDPYVKQSQIASEISTALSSQTFGLDKSQVKSIVQDELSSHYTKTEIDTKLKDLKDILQDPMSASDYIGKEGYATQAELLTAIRKEITSSEKILSDYVTKDYLNSSLSKEVSTQLEGLFPTDTIPAYFKFDGENTQLCYEHEGNTAVCYTVDAGMQTETETHEASADLGADTEGAGSDGDVSDVITFG